MVNGKIRIETVNGQLLKSGSNCSVDGGICDISPDRPPTCGCCSAKYAAATEAVIAITNWKTSVINTPHSPAIDANSTLITAHTASVCHIGQPSSTFAILAAARLTVAMITMLKKSPRYTARNARTIAAGVPA